MSHVDIQILKIKRYRGKPVRVYYRIKALTEHHNVPSEWSEGYMKCDMTEMFSVTFNQKVKIYYKDGAYKFKAYNEYMNEREYQIVDEVVALVEKINFEYYFSLAQSETKSSYEK